MPEDLFGAPQDTSIFEATFERAKTLLQNAVQKITSFAQEDTKDRVNRIEAETLSGSWINPTPEQFQDFKNNKPFLTKKIRSYITDVAVTERLRVAKEAAEQQAELRGTGRTEEGLVVFAPPTPKFSKEFFETQKNILELAGAIATGETSVDPNAIRKLLITLNTDLNFSDAALDDLQTSITLDIVQGVKERALGDFHSLKDIDPTDGLDQKEINKIRKVVYQGVASAALSTEWSADRLRSILPPGKHMIINGDQKNPVSLLARTMAPRNLASSLAAENIIENLKPDEMRINPNVGDTFLDVAQDYFLGGLKTIYNGFSLTQPMKIPKEAQGFKRLENLYGTNWPKVLASWINRDIIIPTVGAVAGGSFITSLAPKTLGRATIKSSSMLGASWRNFVIGLAEGVGWTAAEVKEPVEYWEQGGLDAEYHQQVKSDLVMNMLVFGGMRGLGTVLNRAWHKGLEKYGRNKTSLRIQDQGELRHLDAADRLVLENNELEASLAASLKDAEVTIASHELPITNQTNQFRPLFKAFGDSAELETMLSTPLARNLSESVGGQADWAMFKAGKQTGAFNVMVKDNNLLTDRDTGFLINRVFEDADGILQKDHSWLEKILSLGGFLSSPDRLSGVVRELKKQFIDPIALQGVRKLHASQGEFRSILKLKSMWKTPIAQHQEKKNLFDAMGYGDQFGVALDLPTLQTKFNLNTEGVHAYYKLQGFFKGLWTDLNTHAGKELDRKGFSVVLNSNLDEYGQKLVVKSLPFARKKVEDFYKRYGQYATTPAAKRGKNKPFLEDVLEFFPTEVKERIQQGVRDKEFTLKDILRKLRNDDVRPYKGYNVAHGKEAGVRFYAAGDIASATGQRVVGYNPGFMGGVRYKRTPIRVVAIRPQSFLEPFDPSGKAPQPVLNLYGTRHVADARTFLEQDRLPRSLRKKGYHFSIVKEGDTPNDIWATFDAALPDNIGSMQPHQAVEFVKKVQTEIGFSEEQANAFITALTRPSLKPFLQDRKGMLKGKLWSWIPQPGNKLRFQQKGRTVWSKKTGKSKIRQDLVPILSTQKAGLEYIRLYAATIAQGDFRTVLKDAFTKRYGKYLFSKDAPLGKMSLSSPFNAYQARDFAHGKQVQRMLNTLSATPTYSETWLRRLALYKADEKHVNGGFLSTVGSRLLDEAGLPRAIVSKLKIAGTVTIFAGNVGVGLVQLVPTFFSSVVYKDSPWLARVLAKPLKESKVAPVRWMGVAVDTANVNPITTAAMLKDVAVNVAGIARPKAFTKGRNGALVRDLADSGYMAEARAIEDIKGLNEKVADATLGFFAVGEGTSRTFAWSAARLAAEKEYLHAQKAVKKLVAKGIAPDDELLQWSRWMYKEGDTLRLTKEGMIETISRAKTLNLSFTSTDAPALSKGPISLFTQYWSTLAGQMQDKYIFGEGLKKGQKIRMQLLALATFGPGAIPFLEDAMLPIAWVHQMIQDKSFPKQPTEVVSEFKDLVYGYIDDSRGVPVGTSKQQLSGGMVGLATEHQIEVTNRLFVSSLLTDFFENNINRLGYVFKQLATNQPGEAALTLFKAAPSLKALIENMLESPRDAVAGIMQLQDSMSPEGFNGDWRLARSAGTEEELLAGELDNVRRQIFKRSAGFGKWSSFIDTFGLNFEGKDRWKTPKGQAVAHSDPWRTRLELLTGIGKNAAADVRVLKDLDRTKSEQAWQLGREIGIKFKEGLYMEAQGMLDKATDELDASAVEYSDEVLNSMLKVLIEKDIVIEDKLKLQEATSLGVSSSLKKTLEEGLKSPLK